MESGQADARLVHVDDSLPGITRHPQGEGFVYLDPRRRPIVSERILDRIRKLGVPPAYVDVWICPNPHGHIQATGRDARGRKQYRYHDAWNARRTEAKFSQMVAFAAAMPTIRARVQADLDSPGVTRDRVLCNHGEVARIDALIRVGNDEYARSNRSFGLTTLENRHVRTDGTTISFAFKGKKRRAPCQRASATGDLRQRSGDCTN